MRRLVNRLKALYSQVLAANRPTNSRIHLAPLVLDNDPLNFGLKSNSDWLWSAVPLAPIDAEGYFRIPDTKERIMLDVGLSFNAPNSVQLLKRSPDYFVIGFEPSPSTYFSIFSYHLLKDNPWILGLNQESIDVERDSRRRISNLDNYFLDNISEFLAPNSIYSSMLYMPMAVGTNQGCARLYTDSHHGSNSLIEQNTDCSASHICQVVRLDSIIPRIPKRFTYIDHLKVDAEGCDMDVVESCGPFLEMIIVITLETPDYALMHKYGFDLLIEQPGGTSFVNRSLRHLCSSVDYMIRV